MSEITRNPLCWPNNVPRTIPYNRRRPQFKEWSIAAARGEVLQEINRLNGRSWNHQDDSVIMSTNLILKRDGLPSGTQPEPNDTGVAIYFTLRFVRNGRWHDRPCVLTCDKWNKVAFNLTAIAKDIEAQRARDRWGASNIEQSFRGYLAIPENCGGKSWWDLLGVPSTSNLDTIKAAFRKLALTAHPDHGGTQENWNKLSEAYEEACAGFR